MRHKSEKEYLEENEDNYGTCDCCNRWEADRKCSLCDEDIEHGVVDEGEICDDCCESTFEDEPEACLQNCEDSARVEELQVRLLKKIAEERELLQFDRNPEVYVNSAKTIGIGFFKKKRAIPFEGKPIPIENFYIGNEYDLAKTNNQKHAYSKDYVDEALAIMKKIGEEDLEYEFLSKSGLLTLKGYNAWSVISELNFDWAYMLEERDFLKNVRNGYAIFKDDVKKEIKLVDMATEATLDWNKVKPKQFEELCADILDSFDSMSNCVLTGATGDEGRDIKAEEKVETITGVEVRNWCVQCKHFPSRAVGRQDIEDLSKLHTRFKFDVYCIMTSGTFSPNAMRLLDAYDEQGFKIICMDRRVLEKQIKKKTDLLKKFYTLSSHAPNI